jgi:hypothetical protein
LLSLLCLWGALRACRRRRLVEDLPTSKTTGVVIGLVELKGAAEAERPLTTHLAGRPSVWYAWTVQEHWSRTVTEHYTDSEGRSRTRTRRESGWTTVAEGGQTAPFYLKDDCGIILVLPEGATIEPTTVFDETCDESAPLYYRKGPPEAVPNSDHRRRFSEEAVLLHSPLYVVGRARERKDVVAPEIAADKSAPMFIISTRTEKQVSRGYRGAFIGWSIVGGLLCLAGWLLYSLATSEFSASDTSKGQRALIAVILAGLGYFVCWATGWLWMAYNSLVELRQRVRQAWSQVDVQLKRRHDLIPNLVAAVQSLSSHERNLHDELAFLRRQLDATPPGEPGPDHQACARVLRAVAERYPELTAQDAFTRLMQNLVDTEQRIALARAYYNEIAAFHNTRLELVPDRFIAPLAGLRPQALMAAEDFERAPVQVRLAEGG